MITDDGIHIDHEEILIFPDSSTIRLVRKKNKLRFLYQHGLSGLLIGST